METAIQPRAGNDAHLELAQASMSGLPTVSVCIANYNGMEVIDDCLRSVLEQDCGFPVEIIVHDDASTDDSVQHIRDNYSHAILIESEKNVGFCIANNRMVDQARGEFVLLLNNDASLFPDALATLYQGAQNNDRPVILGLPQYDAHSGELIDIGCRFDPFLNPVPNLDLNRKDVGMVIGACLWIPKTLWDELGGFPDWFGSIAEDMYLCCRARLAGYGVRALPVSGYWHWQGQSFGGNRVAENRLSTTYRRRVLSERNKSFVMVLAYPAPVFQFIFPLHLVLLLSEGVALALLKRQWAPLHRIYLATFEALWHERKRLRLVRREVQAARGVKTAQFFSVLSWFPHKLRLLLKHGTPRIH